jgi:hypothetical protein
VEYGTIDWGVLKVENVKGVPGLFYVAMKDWRGLARGTPNDAPGIKSEHTFDSAYDR